MATASSKTTSVPSQRQPQFAHLETRFVELMTELFQLDEAEALDFGLYRIIRRHNREVRAFLGEIVVDKENLATALSVEASELLEHFVWTSHLQESQVVKERRSAISEEIADLAILLTYLTHDLSIDLEAAVSAKLVANAQKYPIEKARGSNRKYTEL